MTSRIAVALLALLTLLAATGCPKEIASGIAASGPKKYKADILSSVTAITGEIDSGGVSDGSISKLESTLKKWEPEMGKKGTHLMMTQALEYLKKAKSDTTNTFKNNQEAVMKFQAAIDYFKTEVPD
jgi:hypothetical protein